MKFHKTDEYNGWCFFSKYLKIYDDGITLFGFHLGYIHPWSHDAKAYGHPHRIYITIPGVGHWLIGLPTRRGARFYEKDGDKMVEFNVKVPWHIGGTCKWSNKNQEYTSRWITYTKPRKRERRGN